MPADERAADACARLLARAQQAGRGRRKSSGVKLGAMDALIAATCLAGDLVLATRNRGDFDGGVELFSP